MSLIIFSRELKNIFIKYSYFLDKLSQKDTTQSLTEDEKQALLDLRDILDELTGL